ncbi:MAG: hypothetical protein OXD54_13940 [Candidatus Poribacteria bacterium]|nr:hypothetical protein [Candidatus Poribacteria bacterium]
MKQRKPRTFFKQKNIKMMIAWYILLLGGIIILIWKMPAIVSLI